MDINSTAFTQFTDIPYEYTCDGGEKSPPLAWKAVPAKAKSLVLIVDDPDAPDPAVGTLNGLNDWNMTGYRGPCPPIGRHRYFHKLYALDIRLPVLQPATKETLEKAMHGHVIDHCELVGYFQRKK